MTKEELYHIRITKPDKRIEAAVKKRWDHIAKPLDAMGAFETATAKIGAINGTTMLDISKKMVLVLCADNGIVAEGVSQSGQEVTAAVARSMARGESAVCKMAGAIHAQMKIVDIGINADMKEVDMVHRKVAYGTRNFAKEPAMTETEALAAIQTGMWMVGKCKEEGCHILALGEMGIGNTTTSSALAAAFLKCPAEDITGRGAGLDDAGLERKRTVITKALEMYPLMEQDAVAVLSTVGGLDIAGLAGVCIGGAIHHIPVVLDGVITVIAALTAERIVPGVKDYLLASHRSREPAAALLMEELSLSPVIDADMALGEGCGAVMLLSLLDMALLVYGGDTTFADIGIGDYQRFPGEEA